MYKNKSKNTYFEPIACDRCNKISNYGEIITTFMPVHINIPLGKNFVGVGFSHLCPECWKQTNVDEKRTVGVTMTKRGYKYATR